MAAFWSEVTSPPIAARACVLRPNDAEACPPVLAEYMTSCAELACEGVDVTVGGTEGAAISVNVRAQADDEVAEAEGGVEDPEVERTQALEGMMDWFTAQLVAMDGETDEEEEANFVLLGRAILHTQVAEVSFVSSVPAMHRDLWKLVEEAPYLASGGGGVLFVAPRFTNYDAFDDFASLVRSGLKGLVNRELHVRAYHPLHPRAAMRAPAAAMHVFLDDEELFIDGTGQLDFMNGP